MAKLPSPTLVKTQIADHPQGLSQDFSLPRPTGGGGGGRGDANLNFSV